MSKSKGTSKTEKVPYIPSEIAVKAISGTIATIEGLSAPDRGHVLARLREIYFKTGKPGKKKEERQAKKPAFSRSTWKIELEKTDAFKAQVKWKTENKAFLDSITSRYPDSLTEAEEEKFSEYDVLQKASVELKKKMQDEYYASHGITKPPPSVPKNKKKGKAGVGKPPPQPAVPTTKAMAAAIVEEEMMDYQKWPSPTGSCDLSPERANKRQRTEQVEGVAQGEVGATE